MVTKITFTKPESTVGLINAISTPKNKPQNEMEAVTLILSDSTILLHDVNYFSDRVEQKNTQEV